MSVYRIIRSYGRKRSRSLSETQKSNLVNLYKIYGITIPKEKIDPKELFANKFQQIILEIGFGNGEHLISNAIFHKDIAFIGCEPFENGVANILGKIHANKLENIRIFKGDVRILLNWFNEQIIYRTYVLFPDPWVKKRHCKRRLLSTEFISLLQKKSVSDGELVIATDCEDYMRNILENLNIISDNLSFCNDIRQLSHRPDNFISTKYERKSISKDKKCYYLNVYFRESVKSE
ncbi:MAG: tRNA (guanosine(46)-N7)-methyltransferase TrmB [Holosporaceae bacterium]|jgi:tRNA (guanine-N(7)-)-methyltransferase|nr:tRNA (guanosine(46)-N7)-methyltransferase TrmB [Holosporaceae bacterium]